MKLIRGAAAGCLLAGVVGVVFAACGANNSSTTTGGAGPSGSKVVDIYSSLPLQGPSAAQNVPLVNGIRLALSEAGGKAGEWTVKYTSLDDSTAKTGQWDRTRTAANAREAEADPKTVYYIGEWNSGASKVSIPILNEAGIAQVSPANTYVGLTTNLPGSARGEPQIYYPVGTRTYLRIVPSDAIQAGADLIAMKQAGCTRVAVVDDHEPTGAGLGKLLESEKKTYGVNLVSYVSLSSSAQADRAYAARIKGEGANCFFFAGIVANGAVQVTKAVHAALPTAKIFGADGICTDSYTNAAKGGVPPALYPLIECTVATQSVGAYPGGKAFLAAYKAKYGISNPDPYAIFGYEAMKLGLDTIAGLGPRGNTKSAVLKALFAIKARHSVLGTYGFDSNGDTTLKSFGLFRVGSDGELVLYKTLTPNKKL
jgi:branched-chain amino acid transport system substrate-binding protein